MHARTRWSHEEAIGNLERVGVALVLAVATVAAWASPAPADGPSAQGWWATGGEVAATALSPDVPPDGLLVQGGTDGPSAYSALRFSLPPDAVIGELTLHLESVSTPESELRACRLTEDFRPAQGGDMSEAPEYDCADEVTAAVGRDDDSVALPVAGLAGEGELAVALLPSAAADRLVFDEPDGDALEVRRLPGSSSFESSTSDESEAASGAATSPGAPRSVATTSAAAASPRPAPPSVARAGSSVGPEEGSAGPDEPSVGSAGATSAASALGAPGDPSASAWMALLALAAPLVAGSLWFWSGATAVRRVLGEDTR